MTAPVAYDFAPLEELLAEPWREHNDAPSGTVARRLGLPYKELFRLRQRPIDTFTADELAVRAGLHPSEVWPTWIEDACDEKLCGWCREPSRKRFCGFSCRQAWRREDCFLEGRKAFWWARADRYSEQSTTTSEVAC